MAEKAAIITAQQMSNKSNVSVARKYNVGESTIRRCRQPIDTSLVYDKKKTPHLGPASSGK